MKGKKWLSSFIILPLIFAVPVNKQYLLPTPTNVEKLEMIRVIGVDKEDQGVKLSMAAASSKGEDGGGGGGSSGGGGEKNYVIKGVGNTFYEAVEDAQRSANKLLFWGHADIIVLGEETAKEDVSKYIDFLVRDQKTRLSARILVVKGGTAEELLQKKGHENQAIFDGLSEQLQHMKENSLAAEVSLADLIVSGGNARTSYLVPAVVFDGKENYEIDGAAILHEGKVKDLLDEKSSRAALMVRGEFYRSLDVVDTEALGRISIDVGNCHVKKKFYEEKGGVVADVEVDLTGTLAEQFDEVSYGGGRYTPEIMQEVGRAWSEGVRGQIEKQIHMDLVTGYDSLGLADDLYRKNPTLYEKFESKGTMTVNLSVQGKIERVHVLDQEI